MRVLACLLVATAFAAQQRPQVPGAIRSNVVLVPVDVRVIDRDGNPVRDLTQADFTVLENGVPQQIGHFSTQAFETLEPGALAEAPALRRGPGLEDAPIKRRTFLIVLGRGRLQHPAKGIDAVRSFVREGLLPQDFVAVQAYGRITDFTTDRASTLALLDHYERHHEQIEALLNHWFQGPWMFDLEASPGIEKKIAAFFQQAGLPAVRQLPLLDIDSETPFEEQRREAREAASWQRTGRVMERDFVYEPSGRDDSEKLYAAIEYLRYLEGEKHIIYVSERGLVGGRGADAELMGAKAADARVTVSLVRTGGVETSWIRSGRANVFNGPPPATFYANADARRVADLTGGVASAYSYASDTIGRLERATRFQYVLGYYPLNTAWDGQRRRIDVRVNRPGVTVLHRGNYFARQELVPFDRRAFLTHSRISAASSYRALLRDLEVTVAGAGEKISRNAWKARATVSIGASAIAFELDKTSGRQMAALDVAVFVGGRGERRIGEIRRRIELKLEPASYARVMKEGVKFEAVIDADVEPRYLKAIVYDYASDKLGSSAVQVTSR